MDEIFGYFPPTANPPSKPPMLTLLKQARAFGLGFVLATQNPVDLDYKGLSNAGTWFIGRLQTERDKMRVLDGLESALAGAGGFDRATLDKMMSALTQRVFLMRNVHDDAPVLFQSRWALSYLRGPLTGPEIARLMARRRRALRRCALALRDARPGTVSCRRSRERQPPARAAPVTAIGSPQRAAPGCGPFAPERSAGVTEYFLPRPAGGDGIHLQARWCSGLAKLHFIDAEARARPVAHQRLSRAALRRRLGRAVERGKVSARSEVAAPAKPAADAAFAPARAGDARRSYAAWGKSLALISTRTPGRKCSSATR